MMNKTELNPQRQPELLLYGLDSLYVAFYLDTGQSAIDWEELAYRKEHLGQERHEKFAKITLGSETFALKPFGKIPYTYILTNKEFEVRLGEHMNPSCAVQFFSEGLWTHGLEALVERFNQWRDSMELRVIRPEVISRADFAFDYHLPDVDFEADHFVTRAAKDAIYREHGTVQTYTFGRGDVVVRIYDKVAEIEQVSGKAWFYDLWDLKSDVWRIEFQVRGQRLKAAGIKTLADLMDLQADLLRELATKHTTLRKPNDDQNRSRWPLHPLWQALVDDIQALPQTGLVQSIDPKNALDWRLYRMGQSILGSMKGLATLLNQRDPNLGVLTLEEVIEALPGVLSVHHDEWVWNTDIEKRIRAEELGQ